jgi:predicted GH43/DUF377 family glycosyl hydrolase
MKNRMCVLIHLLIAFLFIIGCTSTTPSAPSSSVSENKTENCTDNSQLNYIGFYNGWNKMASPSIGIALSGDGIRWEKSPLPLLTPRTNEFDSGRLNGPYPVLVGDNIYIYYAAYNGSTWDGIGLSILDKDRKIQSRPTKPVLSLGSQGSWDDTKIFRPIVIHDSITSDSGKRFTMIYTGGNSSGINQAGLAFSADGAEWTKYSNNPIILTGQNGSWDSVWVMPDNIVKIGDTYYIVYNGYNGKNVNIGIITTSEIEGAWTKYSNNPLLTNRPDATQTLTQNTNTNSAIIFVNNSSVFEVDEPCFLTSVAGTEIVRIKSRPGSATIELYEPPHYSHTLSGNALIKSIMQKNVGPNQLEYDGSKWKLFGSAWGAVSPYETTIYAEGPTFDKIQWIYKKMPTLNYEPFSTDWDAVSQENLKFIVYS